MSIDLPVCLWMHVDGCPDNSVAVDAIDVFMESVVIGCCTRDEGLRASAAYEGSATSMDHPRRICCRSFSNAPSGKGLSPNTTGGCPTPTTVPSPKLAT